MRALMLWNKCKCRIGQHWRCCVTRSASANDGGGGGFSKGEDVGRSGRANGEGKKWGGVGEFAARSRMWAEGDY